MNTTNSIIAPEILRLYPNLDDGQRDIIAQLDGPMLGVAGPGSGKTLVVALRGLNILLLGRARPEELVLCTYNRAAARELRQRLAGVAITAGYTGDVSRVRVSTIHSLSGSLLRARPERVGLRSGFGILNENEQIEFLSRNFGEIFGLDLIDLEQRGWHWRKPHLVVRNARKYAERICDELVDPEVLEWSDDAFLAALGRCVMRYRYLLIRENLADFEHLQTWAHDLLGDDDVAGQISRGIRHLICDEYQDVSHVQERLLLRLSHAHGNLCVVGDEDQSLYRFRGASAGSLLRFPGQFGQCRTAALNVNYRSHRGIVDFYNGWMAGAADWSGVQGAPPFRYAKAITPHDVGSKVDYSTVIAVAGRDQADEGRQLAEFLLFLQRHGVIGGYDQVALLLHSVQERVSRPYLDTLAGAGIRTRREAGGQDGRGRELRKRPAVLVTTIHQAKGREWDVVIVGSLGFDNPDVDPVGRELQAYVPRTSFEPDDRISSFDHARQHYVAFSRAKHLLVLTGGGTVHPRFQDAWNHLPRWNEMDHDMLAALAKQRFSAPGRNQVVVNDDQARPPRVISRVRRVDIRLGHRLLHP